MRSEKLINIETMPDFLRNNAKLVEVSGVQKFGFRSSFDKFKPILLGSRRIN